MKRIVKFLRSLFSPSSVDGSEQTESCESVSLPQDVEQLLVQQVRQEVEDGRMFLRPDLTLADVPTG